MVKSVTFCKLNFTFLIKSLESKKKKLTLTSFYYLSGEMWLGNSWKVICIDQSKLHNFSHTGKFKNVSK